MSDPAAIGRRIGRRVPFSRRRRRSDLRLPHACLALFSVRAPIFFPPPVVTVTGLWFSAFGQAEREREIAGEHYSSTSLCPFLGTIGFGSLGIVQSSCRRTESPNTICQFDAPRYKRERERTFNFSIFFPLQRAYMPLSILFLSLFCRLDSKI